MTALAKIKDAGFTLSLTNSGNLKIIPFSKLTDTQRAYLTRHKPEIIAELEAETHPRHVTCYTPAGNPMAVLAKDAGHEAFLLMMNPPPKGR